LVVGRIDDHLRLAGQPPERSGVHNPIAVTFEAGALLIRLFRDSPVPCSLGKSGARPEHRSFPLLAKLPTHDGSWPWTGQVT
jgi:hypothetical protein